MVCVGLTALLTIMVFSLQFCETLFPFIRLFVPRGKVLQRYFTTPTQSDNFRTPIRALGSTFDLPRF